MVFIQLLLSFQQYLIKNITILIIQIYINLFIHQSDYFFQQISDFQILFYYSTQTYLSNIYITHLLSSLFILFLLFYLNDIQLNKVERNQKNYQKAQKILNSKPFIIPAYSIPNIIYDQQQIPLDTIQNKIKIIPSKFQQNNHDYNHNHTKTHYQNNNSTRNNNFNQKNKQNKSVPENKNITNIKQQVKQQDDQDYSDLAFLLAQRDQQSNKNKKQQLKNREISIKQQDQTSNNQNTLNLKQKILNKKINVKQKNQDLSLELSSKYVIANKQMWQNSKNVSDKDLYYKLNTKFKLKEFRNNQKAIIKCTLLRNDVFVCMPTGGGKSLNFQLPVTMQPGLTVCVMPLLSLIYDQEYQSQKLGIRSLTMIGNSNNQKQILQALKTLEDYTQGLLILTTPEKILLGAGKIKQQLKNVQKKGLFNRIVIDQVHCVSSWGRDFRKQYQNLGKLKDQFLTVPFLALTATASQKVKIDVIQKLKMKGCFYFQSSFNRPNLYYQVRQKSKKYKEDIIKLCKQNQGKSGIVYCQTKKECQVVQKLFQQNSISSAVYHSGIPQNEKRYIQQRWMINKIQIIIATIAFGMGINKPDVRFVIHQSMSKSVQNYYQQSGRAGRDGNKAQCILFYRRSDRMNFYFMNLKNEYSTFQTKDFNNRQIIDMVKYAQQKFQCRRQIQLNYLGEQFDRQNCHQTCDNCNNKRESQQIQCYSHINALIHFLIELRQKRITLTTNQLVQICKSGTRKMNDKKKGLYMMKNIDYSCLEIFSGWKQLTIQALIFELIWNEVFYEKVEQGKSGFLIVYIFCSPNQAKRFLRQNSQYSITVQKKGKKQKKQKKLNLIKQAQNQESDGFDEFFNQQVSFQNYKYDKSRNSSKASISSSHPQSPIIQNIQQKAQDIQLIHKSKQQQSQQYQELLEFLKELQNQ